jgi:hypothetical protein
MSLWAHVMDHKAYGGRIEPARNNDETSLEYAPPMADAIRRSHARIHCDLPVEVFVGAASGRLLGAGRMLNVSLSGAFLNFAGELQRGTPYRVRVDGPEGPLDLPCRVVREAPRAGAKSPGARQYGLLFNLSGTQERLLRRLLDVLRRRPVSDEKESDFDRSLRNYWSS